MRPLRLVHVSSFFPSHGGGLEAVAGQLATRMARLGHTVDWFAGGRPDPASNITTLRPHAVTFWDPAESWLGAPAPIWSLSAVGPLRSAIRNADIVHVHDYLYSGSLLALWLASRANKATVVTQHIGQIPYENPVSRQLLEGLNRTIGKWVLSRADHVVFVGTGVQAYFESFTEFRNRTCLVPNGVDNEVFNAPADAEARITLRHQLGLRADVPNILFVGRFVEKKGLRLLEAAAKRVSGANWTFIGWGPLNPRRWELDNVRVFEDLRGPELVPWYQAADLLVLPSTGEGFPLVLQEALACGTPVATSPDVIAAFPERDESCVIRFPSMDAAAITETIQALVDAWGRLAEARLAALQLSKQWSWERTVAAYIRLYAVALGDAGEEEQGIVRPRA